MVVVSQRAARQIPVVTLGTGKPKRKFTCTSCFREVEGWEYLVGMDSMSKRSECSVCWAMPRVPPMKPIGWGMILG